MWGYSSDFAWDDKLCYIIYMTDLSPDVLIKILIFLIFPFLGGFIAVRIKVPPIIGYIIGGIFLRIVAGDRLPANFISQFSMLGLILLVFTVGLETNFDLIKRFGKFVLVGGLLQLIISAFFIFFLSLVFRFSPIESLFFGLAFATSSTAIVAKIIQDRGEESSLVGGLAIGLLIFQDLSLIPILIISSSFAASNNSFSGILINILLNVLKSGIVLAIVYYFGQKLIPLLFNKLARVSREIMNLFIIIFIFAALFGFSLLNLSSLLVAFIIGVLLGQTAENQHIFSQIRPFRDLLAIVFFVFLGLTVDPVFFAQNFFKILSFTAAVISIKFLILLFIFIFFKFHSRTAFSLGVFLFQIGETAFIIVYQGVNIGSISHQSFLYAISTVLLSLIITPFLINKKDKLYFGVKKLINKTLPFLGKFITFRLDREVPNIDALSLKDHIVLCGYGRVGKYIGRALSLANIPFVAIDYNFHIVEKAKKEGVNIIYGDPTEVDVLDYADVENAAALILALPEQYSQEIIILAARRLNSKIIIFTRVHQEHDHIRMKDLGVDVIIQPEFEASLSIVRKIYLLKHIDREDIIGKIKRLKIEHGMV